MVGLRVLHLLAVVAFATLVVVAPTSFGVGGGCPCILWWWRWLPLHPLKVVAIVPFGVGGTVL